MNKEEATAVSSFFCPFPKRHKKSHPSEWLSLCRRCFYFLFFSNFA